MTHKSVEIIYILCVAAYVKTSIYNVYIVVCKYSFLNNFQVVFF